MVMKISVIIPVYNERRTIEKIVARVDRIPIDKEIIVVDDGSTDGTREILEKMAAPGNPLAIQVLHHQANQGKGAAIRTGLRKISGDIVVIQDADLEYHPEDWPAAIRLIADGYADAVFGSRFLGPHRVFLFWHWLGNKIVTLLANILFNTILSDLETGFKLVRADVMRALDLQSRTFDIEVEITAKLLKRGYRVYELPITYTGRTYAEGKKIHWTDGLRAIWALFKFRLSGASNDAWTSRVPERLNVGQQKPLPKAQVFRPQIARMFSWKIR
jgi:glycosyltransferase involved in cell wall biosynthesis